MADADVLALAETLPPDQAEGLRWALEALRRPFTYTAGLKTAAELFRAHGSPGECHWWTDPEPDAWWQAQGALDRSEIPQPLVAAMPRIREPGIRRTPSYHRTPTYHRAYPTPRAAWLALAAAWSLLSARRRADYLSKAGLARLGVLAAEMA